MEVTLPALLDHLLIYFRPFLDIFSEANNLNKDPTKASSGIFIACTFQLNNYMAIYLCILLQKNAIRIPKQPKRCFGFSFVGGGVKYLDASEKSL